MNSEKVKGYWSTGRLVIGIISCVLPIMILFQSCAVGLANTLTENGSTSGSQGVVMALCMLVAGIVGICTRNSRTKTGPVISTVFYLFGAVLTFGGGDTYGDLPIWGGVCACFGIVFLIAAIKTKKEA